MAGETTARISGKKRRLRGVVIALVIIAILAGWWHFTKPREMRLVGITEIKLPLLPHGHIYNYFSANRDYSLAYSSLPSITAIRWNGTIRWHVQPPKPFLSSISSSSSASRTRSGSVVSPNGRFYAVVIAQVSIQRLLVWDEGRLTTSISLPLPAILNPQRKKLATVTARLTVLDTGQVFIWLPTNPIGQIVLIEGGKIRAKGYLPKGSGRVTSDGQQLILKTPTQYLFYKITIKNGSICLTPAYKAKESSSVYYLTSDGVLVTDNGAIYNMYGQVSGPTDWQLIPYTDQDPTSSVVMQAHYQFAGVYGYLTDKRILDLHTGATWDPGKSLSLFVRLTPDGQYAIVDQQHNRISLIARDWLDQQQIPLIVGLLSHAYTVPLSIYQRPGRLCARLSIISNQGFMHIKNPITGQWVDLEDVALSRDGHTLNCLTSDNDGVTHYRIMTFKW